VALVLCQQVEDFAQQNGYDLRLKVEEGNVAARKSYETKLSYQLLYTIPGRVRVAYRSHGWILTGNYSRCACARQEIPMKTQL